MIMRKRPELDLGNPPGQIRLPRCANHQTCTCSPGRCEDKDYGYKPKGLYLRDVIKRIQRDEEPMKLPTPIAGPSRALADLKQALLSLCDEAEGLAKGEDGEQLKALVFTKQIRKILKENT